jgi:histidinol-phosphate aminotransferase
MSYFRENILKMAGYTPGEQPVRPGGWIKLNTNENPYPPSPGVKEVLADLKVDELRFYPDPTASALLEFIAELFGLKKENVIAGNGSDDILTIAIRAFVGEGDTLVCPDPTYSLYPELSDIQGAVCRKIPLNPDFSLPDDFVESASGAKLILIPRPNAPVGTVFPLKTMYNICNDFNGVVLIDEAYGDFAEDNCVSFVNEFDNVIVSRTLSKSYSLANIRFGFALASENLISGMMKVKDSYNVNGITQKIALAALKDRTYFTETVQKIKSTRDKIRKELIELNFTVCDSGANFLFAAPPEKNAAEIYAALKENGILVRYFPGKRTGDYLRITVGTDEEMNKLLEELKKLI